MNTEQFKELYARYQDRLHCKINLEAYFTQDSILDVKLARLNLGTLNCSSGQIIACDPFVELEDCQPFFETIPTGSYEVLISVALTKDYGDRYACAKLCISDKKPVSYKMAVVEGDDLTKLNDDETFFGFGVDAGMGCFADYNAQQAFKRYWQERLAEDDSIDPYNDLFCDELEQSYHNQPQYQREGGDWCNFTVPDTNENIIIFASGWGDGYYPCYFGYDENGKVCAMYILFIDIESEFAPDDDDNDNGDA